MIRSGNLRDAACGRLELLQPILRPAELEAFKHIKLRGWSTKVIDATWSVAESAAGMELALQRICSEATAAIEAGYEFIVLSDRAQGMQRPHSAAVQNPLVSTRLPHGNASARQLEVTGLRASGDLHLDEPGACCGWRECCSGGGL
jgi:glutamate synthase (NADPH/NADH)